MQYFLKFLYASKSGFIISENVCIIELSHITYLSRSKTSGRQDRTTDSRLETADETMNGELKGGVHKP
jgi:hypothetical protein